LWMRSAALAAAHVNMFARRALLPQSMWRVLRSRGVSDLAGSIPATGRPPSFIT